MRLFFAIELPDPVRAQLSRFRDQLKSKIDKASFTRDENLHITLNFLGEVDERTAAELIESITNVRMSGPIELLADKIECFPARGPVQIIAAGFGGDLKALNALHRAIEQRCERFGCSAEQRAYRPHVTLVRARPTLPSSVRQTVGEAVEVSLQAISYRMSDFVLMRSRLSACGATYELIHRFSPIR